MNVGHRISINSAKDVSSGLSRIFVFVFVFDDWFSPTTFVNKIEFIWRLCCCYCLKKKKKYFLFSQLSLRWNFSEMRLFPIIIPSERWTKTMGVDIHSRKYVRNASQLKWVTIKDEHKINNERRFAASRYNRRYSDIDLFLFSPPRNG